MALSGNTIWSRVEYLISHLREEPMPCSVIATKQRYEEDSSENESEHKRKKIALGDSSEDEDLHIPAQSKVCTSNDMLLWHDLNTYFQYSKEVHLVSQYWLISRYSQASPSTLRHRNEHLQFCSLRQWVMTNKWGRMSYVGHSNVIVDCHMHCTSTRIVAW